MYDFKYCSFGFFYVSLIDIEIALMTIIIAMNPINPLKKIIGGKLNLFISNMRNIRKNNKPKITRAKATAVNALPDLDR